jgi:hypothetical protein
MSFLSTWFAGYVNPWRMVRGLAEAPAPHWGLYAVVVRGLLNSLLLFLPLALLGRQPSTPPALTLIPAERYFLASVWFVPLFFLGQWLLLSAVLHVILRLLGRPGAIDQILNITGLTGLVVGAFIVGWDWLWIGLGWEDPVALGISHLILDVWAVALTTLGFKRLLGLPLWLGVLLNLVWIALGLPLAIVVMRAPI